MALYPSSVIFQDHRRHGPAMTARTLARALAMQLELPYEAGQRNEMSRAGGVRRSVAGAVNTRTASKSTGNRTPSLRSPEYPSTHP